MITSQPADSDSGSQVAGIHLAAQGTRREPPCSGRAPSRVHWRTPTLTRTGTIEGCQFTLCVRLWDVGGPPHTHRLKENPHRHGRTCELHTDSGPCRESIIFLINVWMKQCYPRTCSTLLWNITKY